MVQKRQELPAKVQTPCADWTMKVLPITEKSIMQLRAEKNGVRLLFF